MGGRSQGACPHVILVLGECIWKVSAVSLVLKAFDDTGSLGSPPCQIVCPPGFMIPHWVTASCFLAGNRGAELKPTTLSLLLLFRVFLAFLFDPPAI